MGKISACVFFLLASSALASGAGGRNSTVPMTLSLSTTGGIQFSFSQTYTGGGTGSILDLAGIPKSRMSFSLKQVPALLGTWTWQIDVSNDGVQWVGYLTQVAQSYDGRTSSVSTVFGRFVRINISACSNCATNAVTATLYMEGI